MNLAAVMAEIGTQLAELDVPVRVYVGAPSKVDIPAAGVVAVVPLPTEITYDGAYGRGMDTLEFVILLVMANPNDKRTINLLAAIASGSGEKSVKQVLEARDPWSACHGVRVGAGVFEGVQIAGVDYLAASFTVSVWGAGEE